MPAKKPTGARSETVRCENCGEYYAVTYKHCPFCEEREDRRFARRRGADYDDEYEDEAYDDDIDEYDMRGKDRGGKRLVTNTRGGGYGRGPSPLQIISTVLSLVLIAAAVYLVITWLKPIIDKGKTGPVPEVTPTPPIVSTSPAPSADASPAPSGSEAPIESGDPGTLEPQPSPDTSTIPATQTATSFTLNQTDFTVSNEWPTYSFKVTFSPAGSTGTITWESSKPDVVSVDQNGVVRGLKNGSATITATMAGGYKQTCIVRSSVTSSGGSSGSAVSPSASASPGGSGTSTGTLKLNHTDFTFSSAGDPAVTMKVSGASGTPSWSIKDSSIATIDANGVVRPVAKGRTTIVCTVDGQTLECIVRCSW